MGQEGVNGSDVGKAFGLVILAGACTGLGGLTVFWGKLNRLWLGGSLGVAAGVMLYIALVDIYSTVIARLVDCGTSKSLAWNITVARSHHGHKLSCCMEWLLASSNGEQAKLSSSRVVCLHGHVHTAQLAARI